MKVKNYLTKSLEDAQIICKLLEGNFLLEINIDNSSCIRKHLELIFTSLKINNSLKVLRLKNIKFEDATVKTLVAALRKNHVLKELYLNCKLKRNTIKKLCELLKNNYCLEVLELRLPGMGC